MNIYSRLAQRVEKTLICLVPYRIDIHSPHHDALERLVQIGALDVEEVGGSIAAIIPDGVTPDAVARALLADGMSVSSAVARDNGSVWLLSPRAVRVGNILIAPPGVAATEDAVRLTDAAAFGTGHHPTTALCIEALEEAVTMNVPDCMLDVGTGSGVLALAALKLGVPRATGLDIDTEALQTASRNAHLNHVADRLQLIHGGPDCVDGVWPLVVANILAAPLMEMAPILVRRVASRGRLILSGIPSFLESEVAQPYQRFGMHLIRSETRAGWTSLVVQTSW